MRNVSLQSFALIREEIVCLMPKRKMIPEFCKKTTNLPKFTVHISKNKLQNGKNENFGREMLYYRQQEKIGNSLQ